MRKLLYIIILFAFCLSLSACHVNIIAEEPTVPTEEPPKPIEIIAPLDIYAGNPEAAGDVHLTLQEDYKLILDLESEDYPYSRYYDPHSSRWWWITIAPMVLEEDLQDQIMAYTIRTNYSAFVDSHYDFLGQKVTVDEYVNWRGLHTFTALEVMDRKRPERIWVDILIRANGKVVGFAVLEIVDMEWNGNVYEGAFAIEDRYTEYYPLIDGRFQEVSEEFAWQRIEQYHQYAE